VSDYAQNSQWHIGCVGLAAVYRQFTDEGQELRAAKRTHAGTADARNQQAETNLVESKARERRLQAELAAATRRLSVIQDVRARRMRT
jgi:hypothetical protein